MVFFIYLWQISDDDDDDDDDDENRHAVKNVNAEKRACR